MSSTCKRTIPIDQCRHVLRRFDDACDLVEVQSPGNLPVDVPATKKGRRLGAHFRHGLEFTLAVAVGFLLATALFAG